MPRTGSGSCTQTCEVARFAGRALTVSYVDHRACPQPPHWSHVDGPRRRRPPALRGRQHLSLLATLLLIVGVARSPRRAGGGPLQQRSKRPAGLGEDRRSVEVPAGQHHQRRGVLRSRHDDAPQQIQSFLESKVPVCQSGYTCLKDWYDTSRTTTADAMCGAYSGGIRERASTIIYKVAQACGINPQVLLATLQKEQGLVTPHLAERLALHDRDGSGLPRHRRRATPATTASSTRSTARRGR